MSKSVKLVMISNQLLTQKSHKDDTGHVYGLETNVDVEVRMILDADAVVHPLAMMIKSIHALVADVTMARISSAYDFTCWAKHVRIKFLYQLEEWNRLASSHVSRLHFDRQDEKDLRSKEH